MSWFRWMLSIPKQSEIYSPLLMCYIPLWGMKYGTDSHYMHQTRGQNLLSSSMTHRSKRPEKGQAGIKCACEKSTHRTSRVHLLAYLSSITRTQLHTHKLNMVEWLKVSLAEAGLNLTSSAFRMRSFPQKHRLRIDRVLQLLPQKSPGTCLQLSKISTTGITQNMPLQLHWFCIYAETVLMGNLYNWQNNIRHILK